MEKEEEKEEQQVKEPSPVLEFLMTYGWAILIVLIVIAALFYFKVI